MSTIPEVTPQTPVVIPNWIHSWGAFVKHHERIILIGASALVLWHFANKAYDGYKLGKDSAAQVAINKEIADLHTQNAATLATLAQLQQSYNTTVETLNAEIAKKQQVTIIQKQKDATMPPTELSKRWEDLISAPEGSVAPTPDGKIAVSVDAAHKTVDGLENLPLLNSQLNNAQTQLTACNQLSAKKDVALAGVQQELTDEKNGRVIDAKKAADELSDAKKKSFWNGTKLGAGLVIVAEIAIKVLK